MCTTAFWPRRLAAHAAVVAIGSGKEGCLAEVAGEFVAGEVVVGHVGDVAAGLVRDVASHGEGASQDLERVQAEAIALVLDAQVVKAQASSQIVQAGERGHRVLREALVEGTGLRDVIKRHDAEVGVVALLHVVVRPLNPVSHASLLSSLLPNVQIFHLDTKQFVC